MKNAVIIAIAVFTGAACSCSDDKKPPERPMESKSFLLDAEDLDLETIMGLVQANEISNARQLEELVNADNGINNVDLDDDDRIDYVMVTERREGDATVLDFDAVPSSKGTADAAVTVATLRVGAARGSNQVRVQGGYPSYVNGYDRYYYEYEAPRSGLTVGEALFLMWALDDDRPVFRPHYPSSWRSRPIYSSSKRRSLRTSYRQKAKVAPVRRAARPATFKVRGKAPKATGTAGTGLSGRKGAASSFQKDTRAKTTATGFGAKPSTTGSSTRGTTRTGAKPATTGSSTRGTTRTGTKPSTTGSSTRSGFGSSSGSRRGSSFGSSSGSRRKKR